jgi:hypothetical protein
MLAVRAAILVFLFGMVNSPSTSPTTTSAVPARECAAAAFRVDPSLVCPISPELPRSSTLTRFHPWKARPKILPVESNHQFFEETDLGPALVPTGFNSPSAVAPSAPRLPSLSPLRC